MSVLELKGELHEFISSVQNEDFLKKLKKTFNKMAAVEDVATTAYSLTPEQEAELMISLEESYDETKVMDIEEAKKIHAKWLKK
jgi:hypothetical protein